MNPSNSLLPKFRFAARIRLGPLSNPEFPDLQDGDRGERGEEVRVEMFPGFVEAPEAEVTVWA